MLFSLLPWPPQRRRGRSGASRGLNGGRRRQSRAHRLQGGFLRNHNNPQGRHSSRNPCLCLLLSASRRCKHEKHHKEQPEHRTKHFYTFEFEFIHDLSLCRLTILLQIRIKTSAEFLKCNYKQHDRHSRSAIVCYRLCHSRHSFSVKCMSKYIQYRQIQDTLSRY